MSDLLDAALERWDGWQLGDWPIPDIPDLGTMDTILDAARKVANLDYDAARDALIAWDNGENSRYVSGAAAIVDAALGIGEDTESNS